MGRTFKKSISILLALALIIGLLPMYAAAAGEPVITGVAPGVDASFSGTAVTVPVGKSSTTYDLSSLILLITPGQNTYAFYSSATFDPLNISSNKISGTISLPTSVYIVVYNTENSSSYTVYPVVFEEKQPSAAASSITSGIVAGKTFSGFKASDFSSSGATGSLTHIIITSLPANGTLMYNTSPVSAGSLPLYVPVGSIPNLSYIVSSSGTQTFNFKVRDAYDESANSAVMTMTISAPKMPEASTISKTVSANTTSATCTFTESDFTNKYAMNDVGTLSEVVITYIPDSSRGTLKGTVNGIPNTLINANTIITLSNLGTLVFTPNSGLTASTPAVFGWRGSDASGNTSNESTITISLSAPAAPTVTSFGISVYKAATYTFTKTDFTSKFSGGTNLAKIRIASLPSGGTLRYNGANITSVPYEINEANISLLTYLAPSPTVNTTYSFAWNACDSSGVYSASNATCSTAVLTSQVISGSFSKSAGANTTTYFTLSEFTSVFQSLAGRSLYSITIRSVLSPSGYGTLRLGSSVISTGQTILASDIANLNFVSSDSSARTITFTYSAHDGAASSDVYGTVTLNVASSATTAGNFSKSVAKNGTMYFDRYDFENAFYSSTGRSLESITIKSLPSSSYGTLRYSNSTFSVDRTISVSNISYLTFIPVSGVTGTTSFRYTAYDGYSSSAYEGTVTIYIGASVTVTNFSKSVPLNTTTYFTQTEFENAFSSDNVIRPTRITIKTLPSSSYGYLRLNSATVYAGDNISYSDIPYLNFVPVSGKSGTATFTYTAYDGYYESPSAATVTLNIGTSSSKLSDGVKNTGQDTRLNFILNDFTSLYSDSGSLQGITIVALPSSNYGILYLNDTAVYAGQYISQSNIQNLNFRPSAGRTGYTEFTFYATNGTVTTNTATMRINIGLSGDAVPYISTFNITESYTTTRTISCTLSAYDSTYGTPTRMRLSLNGGEYGAEMSYSQSFTYTLPATEGQHSLSVKVISSNGAVSAAATDTVIYDITSPQIVGAVISSNRRTVMVTLSEMVDTPKSTDSLKNSIQFGYSNSSNLSLGTYDSVTLLNSTLTVYLENALPDIYDRITISGGTIYDKAGNYISSSVQQIFEPRLNYTVSKNSGTLRGTVTFAAANPTSSGKLFCFLDPLSLSDIVDNLGFNDAELRFEMPAASGTTATLRSLTLPGELFNTANLNRVKTVILTDGSVDISIDTAAVRNSLTDYNAPFVITLESVSLSDITATSPSFSRTITLQSGGKDLTQLKGNAPIKFSAPYPASSSNENMVVTLRREGTSNYTPIYSSAYSTNDASAYFNKTGTYVVAVNGVSFSDVPSSLWAHSFVSKLAARKIIEGVGSGKYSPAGTVTNAEYLKMLTTALSIVDENASCNMKDVTSDKWYYKYVASAVKAGIISDNTYLYPETAISRENMCVYAYRAASAAGFTFSVVNSNPAAFSDQSAISSGALLAVQTLQKANIIVGSNGKFNPTGSMTRAEAAKVVSMVMDEQRKGY